MTNAMEGNYAIKKKQTVEISRQQVVDCSSITNGCGGGWPPNVVVYLHSFGAIPETSYSYTAKKSTCKYDTFKSLAKNIADGVETLHADSQNMDGVYALLQKGPASIGLDANGIMNYKTGIISLKGCSSNSHAVLLVGYGVDSKTNTPYWLIKNSWGTYWGESGYMRATVKDTDNNNCLINKYAQRPFIN